MKWERDYQWPLNFLKITTCKEKTYCSVDLPILISHAVSVVQVGKGLGCTPRLQVASHPDWGPHLCTIYSVSGTIMMLRASMLHLDEDYIALLWKYFPNICCLEHDQHGVAPLGLWRDRWWLHAPWGRGPFLVHLHLLLYRNLWGAPVSLRWCELSWSLCNIYVNGKKSSTTLF